jgi:hypothetical protein
MRRNVSLVYVSRVILIFSEMYTQELTMKHFRWADPTGTALPGQAKTLALHRQFLCLPLQSSFTVAISSCA